MSPSVDLPYPDGGSRHGVVIVMGCFIGLMVGFGPLFGATFSVFVKPLSDEFGWSRSAVSLGISVTTLVIALAAPSLGSLADRWGPKRLIVGGILFYAAAVASMSLLPAVYALYLLLMGTIGLFGAATTSLLYAPVLAQWFHRRLGLSLGIAMTGLGLGAAVGPILAQSLVDDHGWRSAYVIIGLIIAAIGLLNGLFLLREHPLHRRRQSTGSARGAGGPELAGMTRSEAVRTALFARTFVAILLMALVASGFSVHLVPMLTDRGVSGAAAAGYLGLFGLAVMISRLAAGVLLDKVRSGLVGMVSFAAPAGGLLLLATVGEGPVLVLSVLLVGLAYGAESDLLAYIVRNEFGTRAYGAIFGLIFAAFNIGALLGPLLMAASYDLLDSYVPMVVLFAILSLISAMLIFSAGRAHLARGEDRGEASG